MFCKTCKLVKKSSDFFKKDICYKCQYKEKIKEIKTTRKCKNCKSKLPSNRWKYCSKECVTDYEKKNKRKYWTRSLNISKLEFNTKIVKKIQNNNEFV